MYSQLINDIRSIQDLEIVINYYYPNQLKNKTMKCPFHNDSTPSFKIVDKGQGAFYKCFGCEESGDIIEFIKKVEGIRFIPALEKAYLILNKQLNLPKSNFNKINTVNKANLNQYYEEKIKESLENHDLDSAFRHECKKDRENKQSYYIKFPYTDDNNKPLRIWENLNEILEINNISVMYNEIAKDIEITGVEGSTLESQLISIHSLSNKYGFPLNLNMINNFINKIANNNPTNPVTNFLEYCYETYDNDDKYIQMLCNAIITNSSFDEDLKKILIRKWLLNTASIAFNDGKGNTEGVLTMQGKQGIGKTRLIRKIVPMYVKTGLELDPSDKDKVYQCIKYWVCELGELDSTFKRDLAKLKAFITEQTDEFRRPYGLVPIKYPRKTSFYATVNNEEFLKDESGNRRYWVIPVEKIDFELVDKIDIYQLWGEVMHIREKGVETIYLNQSEMNMLNRSNNNFKVMGQLEIEIDKLFVWEAGKGMWKWMSSKDIINKLYIKSTKGLRATLESYGAIYQKKGNKRGYIMPPENLMLE